MKTPRLNWPLWAGLLLSVIAFLSYFFIFVQIPLTRDFPWANLALFAIAGVLLFIGFRRAFASGSPKRSKIAGGVVTAFSVLVLASFVFTVFITGRWLPPAPGAPRAGQKAPDFTLADTSGKSVSLNELLSTPIDGKAPKGVLLIFYRGYW